MAAGGGRVKGAGIQVAWLRAKELLETGQITRDQLESRLSRDALEMLEEKLLPSLWYPIEAGSEISQLVVDVDGGGQLSHLATLGAETAQRLLERGTFKDFIEGAAKNKNTAGQSLVRLSQLMLDFAQWRFEGRSLRDFEVIVTDAEQLPETTRFSIQGFIAALTSQLCGSPIACESERPSPDTVVFRSKVKDTA